MVNRKLKAIIIEIYESQANFAAEIGKSQGFVSEVVRGRQKLSLDDQYLWAAKLKRLPRELFPADRG